MTRKAEVVSVGVRRLPPPAGRTARLAGRTVVRTLGRPFGARPIADGGAPPSTRDADARAWQLIHDDPFDGAMSEAQIAGVVSSVAARSATPHVELLRRLVGIDDMSELEAKVFFERVVVHRRAMAEALGRAIHIRVAALDLLTTRALAPSGGGQRRDSRPIIVTSSLLEKAFEVATADGVTGLPQRAHFMNLLSHELLQRKRRNL